LNGPKIKKIFSCDGCEFLDLSTFGKYSKNSNIQKMLSNTPYKCYHDNIVKNQNSFDLMAGDINEYKITPTFCPFLMNKMRNEKLKELTK